MNFKRICMGLISLVLVCCLLVNVSPIKVKAIEPISSTLAVGVAACMILFSAGVVFHPKTQEHIEAAGQAFSTYLYQWGTSAEQLDAVDEFIGGLSIYEGDPDDDDDWQPRIDIPDLIKRGVALFTAGCIAASGLVPKDYSVDVPVVSEGQIKEGESIAEANAAIEEAATHPYALFMFDNSYNDGPYIFVGYSDTSPLTVTRSNGWYNIQTEDGSSFRYYGHYWSWHEWQTSTDVEVYSPTSVTWFGTSNSIGAPYYVGDIPEKVQNGEYNEDTLPLPDSVYYGNLIDPDLGAAQSIIELSEDLVNGEISFDQYISYIAVPDPSEEPSVDPSEEPEPSETQAPELVIPEPGIDTDSLANTDPNTFLEHLGSYITTPFRWIWSNIETYFETLTRPELWTETIPEIAIEPARWIWEKIQTELAPLLDPDTLARPLPEIIAAPFQNLWNNMQNAFDALQQAADNAAQKVVEGLKEATVPDKDYLSDKVNALCAEFAFADSIVKTAKALNVGLAGVTTEPPVIYIDLGATRGSYNIGGVVPFIDMRWYEEYKPTADALISAFLWICFAWRMLIHLPGIISGSSGIFTISPVASTRTGSDLSVISGTSQDPTYKELLDIYHEDIAHDNPSWPSIFGRNPSYSTLKQIYSSDPDDL